MCADMLQDMIDYCSVEGMKRKEARDKAGNKNDSKDEAELQSLRDAKAVGFAMAKKDLDWIDESHKF